MSDLNLPAPSPSGPGAPVAVEYFQPGFRVPSARFVPAAPKQRYWLHALLLLATFCTTLVVGRAHADKFPAQPVAALSLRRHVATVPVSRNRFVSSTLLLGLPFSATLMLILMAHEMGHYLYCRFYAVNATLPFFIPAPTLIGTPAHLSAFARQSALARLCSI